MAGWTSLRAELVPGFERFNLVVRGVFVRRSIEVTVTLRQAGHFVMLL